MDDSDGHRANILSNKFRDIGVGYVYEPDDTYPGGYYGYTHYWSQEFGTQDCWAPTPTFCQRPPHFGLDAHSRCDTGLDSDTHLDAYADLDADAYNDLDAQAHVNVDADPDIYAHAEPHFYGNTNQHAATHPRSPYSNICATHGSATHTHGNHFAAREFGSAGRRH